MSGENSHLAVGQSFSHDVNFGCGVNFKQVLECYSYHVLIKSTKICLQTSVCCYSCRWKGFDPFLRLIVRKIHHMNRGSFLYILAKLHAKMLEYKKDKAKSLVMFIDCLILVEVNHVGVIFFIILRAFDCQND